MVLHQRAPDGALFLSFSHLRRRSSEDSSNTWGQAIPANHPMDLGTFDNSPIPVNRFPPLCTLHLALQILPFQTRLHFSSSLVILSD